MTWIDLKLSEIIMVHIVCFHVRNSKKISMCLYCNRLEILDTNAIAC